jgi:glucosamine 6-phosphate synthetase-like amidotransferase/phosphosugar isomerase protein
MCGLAGLARHPEAGERDRAAFIFEELVKLNEKRGRHATGIAVAHVDKVHVGKWAVTASKVLESEPWAAMMGRAKRARIVIGHTRYATIANANDDDAAHPFAFGSTVGAHNGHVGNWRDLKVKFEKSTKQEDAGWISDSEGVVEMLSRVKKPDSVLDALDGWWALTWAKKGRLFLTRTSERPLSCAYVPFMRTLFWSSERTALVRVLEAALPHGTKDAEIYGLNEAVLYEFDPTKFNGRGTGRKQRVLQLRGKKTTESRKTSFARSQQAGLWDGRRQVTPDDSRVRRLQEENERLAARVEFLEEEMTAMWQVLKDAGLGWEDETVAIPDEFPNVDDLPDDPPF